MDKKLTDAEIIKALECCSKDEINGLNIFTYGGVPMRSLLRYILDLINRLQDKNKAYKYYYDECLKDLKKANTENERLKDTLNATIAGQETLQRYIATAKTEAYKEFAERLKEKSYFNKGTRYEEVVYVGDIYNLLKELEGDSK